MKRRFFPAALNVRGRPCLVIGGDAEADDKAARLADAGAKVTVLAGTSSSGLTAARGAGAVIENRDYRDGDISDQFMVVLATRNDPALATVVAAACRARRVLLAAIDQPDISDVVQVSLFERGPLTLAISTDGQAPALAKRIRQGLEAGLEEVPLEPFLAHLSDLRARLEREVKDPAERRRRLIAAVAGFEFRASVRFPPDWTPPVTRAKDPS